MASRDEILRIVLQTEGKEKADALAAAIDEIGKSSGGAEKPAEALVAALGELTATSKNIQGFVSLKAAIADTETRLIAARNGLATLNSEFDRSDTSNRKITSAFKAAEKAVADLTAQETRLQVELAKSQGTLEKSGVDTTKLAEAQKNLQSQASAVAQQIREVAAQSKAASESSNTFRGAIEKVGSGLKGAGEQALELGKRLLQISGIAGVVATALAAISGGRIFGGAVEEATKVEASLARIKALTGATQEQFERFGKAAEAAAAEVNVPTEKAAAALAALAEQGQTADQALASLVPTLQLAKIAAIDVSQAAAIVDDTLDQFGLNVDQAARVVDVLTVASKGSKEGLSGLSTAMGTLAPLAKEIGLNFEQTATVLGLLGQNGFSAEKATKGLRSVFAELQDPTSKLRSELRALGDNSNSFSKALETLSASGERGKEALLALDGSSRSVVTFLLQQGPAAFNDFAKAIENSGGAAKTTSEEIDNSLSGAFSRFTNTFSRLAASLAEPILAPLQKQLESAAEGIRRFSESADFSRLKASVKDFVTSSIDSIGSFVKSIDFSKAAQSVADFLTSAKSSFDSFRASAAELLTVVSAIGSGISLVFNGIKTAIAGSLSVISQGISDITDRAAKLVDAIPAVKLTQLFTGAKTAAEQLKPVIDDASNASQAFGDVASDAYNKTGEAVAGLIQALSSQASESNKASQSNQQLGESAEVAGEKVATFGAELAVVPDYLLQAAGGGDLVRTNFVAVGNASAAMADRLKEAKEKLLDARESFRGLSQSGNASSAAMDAAARAVRAAEIELEKLSNQSKKSEKDADSLKGAFAELGIASQSSLTEKFKTQGAALDTLAEKYRNGQASIEDVRRAFLAYAETALASVKDSDTAAKEQVESQLRVKASILGTTEQLEKLGKTGEAAGKSVANSFSGAAQKGISSVQSSAQQSAQSMDNLADSAKGAAKATQEGKEKLEDFSGAANELVQAIGAARNGFSQVSEAAAKAFDTNLVAIFNREFDSTGAGLGRVSAALVKSTQLVTEQINEQRKALKSQVQAYEELGEKGPLAFEATSNTAETTLRQLEGMSSAIKQGTYDAGLLGQQELGPLQSALDGAISRVKALADAERQAADQLKSLNEQLLDQIDQANGNRKSIEDRRYQDQLKQIDELAKKSGAAGAADAAQARKNAEEIHATNLRNIEEEKNKRIAADKEVAANRSSRGSSGSTSSNDSSNSNSGSAPATRAGSPINIVVNANLLTGDKKSVTDLARMIHSEIQNIQNRSR